MKKNKVTALLFSLMLTAGNIMAQPKVIAHRGYWDCSGSAQNSIASLNKAHEIKAYGSEFDVRITLDGIPVINHDDTIGGLSIETVTYDQLKDITLSNGEKLPTLEQYLSKGKKNKGTRLILEIKPHHDKATEDKAVAAVLALVKKYKTEKMTDYISFSMNICKELKRLAPVAEIAYLKGDVSPRELKDLGMTGLDYHYKILEAKPDWVKEAHELGLTVNVWTVNEPAKMQELIAMGVDYITTDKPVELIKLLAK